MASEDALFDDDAQLLPADWDLPADLRARLGHRIGRQRAMAASGHLLILAHRVPVPDDDERRGTIAWRAPNGRWRSPDGRDGLVALRETIEQYEAALTRIDDTVERATEIDAFFDVLEQLAPLSRAARHLHDTLQRAREMCTVDRTLIDLRDRAYAVERRAELLVVDARFALDRALARSRHEQALASRRGAEASDRLNRMVALFLPLATIAAILGMNVKSGLEDLAPPWPFVLILGVGGLAGLLLSAGIHRKP